MRAAMQAKGPYAQRYFKANPSKYVWLANIAGVSNNLQRMQHSQHLAASIADLSLSYALCM